MERVIQKQLAIVCRVFLFLHYHYRADGYDSRSRNAELFACCKALKRLDILFNRVKLLLIEKVHGFSDVNKLHL